MTIAAPELRNAREHPRVRDLATKLTAAREAAKQAERAAAAANQAANELAGAAEETEVLAELGEGNRSDAQSKRRQATEAAERAAAAVQHAAVKQRAAEIIARLLTEAERDARDEIEADFRRATQHLVTELHRRLHAAAVVNEELIGMLDARPVGMRLESVAWEDLRVTPQTVRYTERRRHWQPGEPLRGPREGLLQWEETVKAQGYEL